MNNLRLQFRLIFNPRIVNSSATLFCFIDYYFDNESFRFVVFNLLIVGADPKIIPQEFDNLIPFVGVDLVVLRNAGHQRW